MRHRRNEQHHIDNYELWRNTQVAEEVPLLRVYGARVQIPLSPLLFAIYVVRIFFEKVVDKRQTI